MFFQYKQIKNLFSNKSTDGCDLCSLTLNKLGADRGSKAPYARSYKFRFKQGFPVFVSPMVGLMVLDCFKFFYFLFLKIITDVILQEIQIYLELNKNEMWSICLLRVLALLIKGQYLEAWREVLELKGLKINSFITEYMEFRFSKIKKEDDGMISRES